MTDRRVFRYRLPITDRVTLVMPTGAEVLSAGPPRDGFDELDLWAVVDLSVITEQDRRFRVFGTGNPMPDDCGRFVGTVTTHGGGGVWHVFEVARCELIGQIHLERAGEGES